MTKTKEVIALKQSIMTRIDKTRPPDSFMMIISLASETDTLCPRLQVRGKAGRILDYEHRVPLKSILNCISPFF